MKLLYSCTLAACTLAGLSTSQSTGDAPRVPGAAIQTGGAPNPGPLANEQIVPASARTVITGRANAIPFSWTPTRFQSVYLGSELPQKTHVIRCIGFRHGNRTDTGARIDMEIWLGYTTKTATTLGTSFDKNFDITTLKKQLVYKRKWYTVVDMEKPNKNPLFFKNQIALDTPFVWTPVKGRNLLIEIKIHGNSNNNRSFSYYVEYSAANSTTSRLYSSNNANATTGSITRGYGPVFSFDFKCKVNGAYDPYGAGCPGTGGTPGIVLPSAMATKMGNSNNYYGVGRAGQRYQQVFTGSQVGRARVFTGHSLRFRQATYTGGSQTLEIKASPTTYTPATLSTTFATNITTTQTTVFKKKSYSYPNMVSNSDPTKFGIDFKWDAPFIWKAGKTDNLLIEVLNSSTSSLFYFPDAVSGNGNVTRLYATGTTATTGSVGRSYGLVMRFNYTGLGSSVPVLGSVGRPVIGNKTFAITLAQARKNTAAALITGFSNTNWGAIKLPFDLTVLGAKGCKLLASPDIFSAVATGTNGSANLPLAIPNISSLVGIRWYNQFLVLDPQANTFGMAFSAGRSARIGEQ